MMTRQEEAAEFWLLTQGILQDARVDAEEARVIKRWLEEHQKEGEFAKLILRLDKFLMDGFVDRFESRDVIDSIAFILRTLRTAPQA